MHKCVLSILFFCICGCSAAVTGKNARELRYGMTPIEVNRILDASCYMPFLTKLNDTEYRYVIYPSNSTYPSLHLVFKNGVLSKASLPNVDPFDFDTILNKENINFESFDLDYDLSEKLIFEKLLLAPFAVLMNLGNIHGKDLFKINLNSNIEKIKSTIGSPDEILKTTGSSLWVYEEGHFIGKTGYVFEFHESKLISIFRDSYVKKFDFKRYEESKTMYLKTKTNN